jgi:hypothetical protein
MTADLIDRQLDYLHFLSGLSFILLAVNAWRLTRQPHKKHPWEWIALFGLLRPTTGWRCWKWAFRHPGRSVPSVPPCWFPPSSASSSSGRGCRASDGWSLGWRVTIGPLGLIALGSTVGLPGVNAAAAGFGLVGAPRRTRDRPRHPRGARVRSSACRCPRHHSLCRPAVPSHRRGRSSPHRS